MALLFCRNHGYESSTCPLNGWPVDNSPYSSPQSTPRQPSRPPVQTTVQTAEISSQDETTSVPVISSSHKNEPAVSVTASNHTDTLLTTFSTTNKSEYYIQILTL